MILLDVVTLTLLLLLVMVMMAIVLMAVYRAGRRDGEEVGALREQLRRNEIDARIERRIEEDLRRMMDGDHWPEELPGCR